jgi:hypothetical protein
MKQKEDIDEKYELRGVLKRIASIDLSNLLEANGRDKFKVSAEIEQELLGAELIVLQGIIDVSSRLNERDGFPPIIGRAWLAHVSSSRLTVNQKVLEEFFPYLYVPPELHRTWRMTMLACRRSEKYRRFLALALLANLKPVWFNHEKFWQLCYHICNSKPLSKEHSIN